MQFCELSPFGSVPAYPDSRTRFSDVLHAKTCTVLQPADPDFEGWVWAVVEVPVERYFGPAEKLNITLPRLLLAKIDEYARAHGESRSGFLAETARAAMR